MSKMWKAVLIGTVVVVGLFVTIKLLPLWATLMAVGTFSFGVFSGYILKDKEIVEKIVEKPIIKEVVKEVIKEVPVEKIVYLDRPVSSVFESLAAVPPIKSKHKKKKVE